MPSDIAELRRAYEEVMLLFLRDKITRAERDARIIALHNTPAAAGLSSEQRNAIASEAVTRARDLIDEVYFSESGKWQ